MPDFFTNTIWYIILGLITVSLMVHVLSKTPNRKRIFAFYLTASGLGFSCEANLFMIFKAYNYYPKIFPGSTFHDGLAGNLFSQFSIAAVAVLIATQNLSIRYCIAFAFIFYVIECLFLFLGIYQHNWYQAWMTFVLLLIYFPLVKALLNKLNRGLSPLLYYIYLFLGLWPLHFAVSTWPYMLLGKVMFYAYISADPVTNSTLLMVGNYILFFTVMYIVYFLNLHWLWKALGIVGLFLINYAEYMLQLLYVEEGWFFIYSFTKVFSLYLYIYILDRCYSE